MTGESPTSWIWPDEASGGVKGARLNLAHGLVEWVEQPGCACGNAIASQTVTDFREQGPMETPPADVLEEMRNAIRAAPSIDSPRGRG
ncbi:MAG: hypothetical protein OXG53_12365 [Chloroflexi bacterium]|nr:hypothetical protein [Chloroflexota bacterium]